MRAVPSFVRAIALAATVLAAFLAGCTDTTGSLLLIDETAGLDRAQIAAAAAPLLARGAKVAILVAARGDQDGADFTRRLDAAGLTGGGQIRPDTVALYVSYEPRYSELRAGTRWSGGLPDSALREIRTLALNPALRDDRLGDGVAETLRAIEGRIASPPPIDRNGAWALGAFVVVVVVGLLALSDVGGNLRRWWLRTPPGRLLQWLYDQTPPGRRRVERIIRQTDLRLSDRADSAHEWCKAAGSGPKRAEAAPLLRRLTILDQERAALRAAPRSSATERAMDRLAWTYTSLAHEAERLVPPRPAPKSKRVKRGAAAGSAASFDSGSIAGGAYSASSDSASSDSASSTDSSSSGGPSSDGGAW